MRIILSAVLLFYRELQETVYLLLFHVFFLPWISVPFWFRYVYFWNTPHDVARKWMESKGINIFSLEHSFTFGSTPLKTWDLMIRRANIEKGDSVYDIGCGTGLACFFLARRLKSRIVGIDYNEDFITRADWIRKKTKAHNPVFLHDDARSIDFSDADVVYMFSTTFTEELLADISRRLRETLVYGATVISVTNPIEPRSAFEVVDVFMGQYYFGNCTIYVHRYIQKEPLLIEEDQGHSSFSDILISKQQK